MRRLNNKFTRLSKDLKQLKIGDTLSHAVNLELRQWAYDEARRIGVSLCIRAMPLKRQRFEITRIG